MRPRLIQVKALKFGTVGGAFGICHVDPDNPDAKEPMVDERAIPKLEEMGYAKRVKTKVVDDDDGDDAAPATDKSGDAAAERVQAGVDRVKKATKPRAAKKPAGRGGRKAPAKPAGTRAARPEDAPSGSDTRDSLALPKDVLATDSARGDIPAQEGEGGAGEDSPPAE